jgi:hypothetical protein
VSDPVLALGGPSQQEAVGVALAPVLQLAPGDVPDIATLLFGPLARGGTIGYASA